MPKKTGKKKPGKKKSVKKSIKKDPPKAKPGEKESTAIEKVNKKKGKKKSIVKLTDTNSLIEYALKNKSGIESLKEILKMKHDEESRRAEKMFHINFCKMQAEFPVIPKTKTVYTKAKVKMYAYAPLSTIIPMIKDIIADHGFSYRWTKEFPEDKQIKINFHLTGYGHTEICSMKLPIMPRDNFVNDIQQSGSTSTYGERYTLCDMLGIVSDEDDDGRGSSQPATKPTTQAPMKDVTPESKTPEVIQPKKPMLPAVINIDDLCSLGIYEKTPMKYKSVPLGHLMSMQKEAGNPEVLDTVIHYVIDEKISPLKNKLKYGEKEMIALIKADLNLDTDYVDLDQSNKIKVYRSLKILVDDMPAQEKK